MSLNIIETELPNHAGRRIRLETEVDGKKFWRVWYEGTRYTVEDKRTELRRDVKQYLNGSASRVSVLE
jgi:hypothetical protein